MTTYYDSYKCRLNIVIIGSSYLDAFLAFLAFESSLKIMFKIIFSFYLKTRLLHFCTLCQHSFGSRSSRHFSFMFLSHNLWGSTFWGVQYFMDSQLLGENLLGGHTFESPTFLGVKRIRGWPYDKFGPKLQQILDFWLQNNSIYWPWNLNLKFICTNIFWKIEKMGAVGNQMSYNMGQLE